MPALRNALSEERLQAYDLPTDNDPLDGVARYLWNLSLTVRIQPALHALEITLRNHLFAHAARAIGSKFAKYQQIQCWLDADPTPLEGKEYESVRQAKDELARGNRPLTSGRLISKLGFGFWVSLCKRPYEQGRKTGPALWPAILSGTSFPGLPKANRNRALIFNTLDPIRALRNRVSHHEPIWDHDLKQKHTEILSALSWMNSGFASAVQAASPLEAEVDRGPAAYRPLAESLVRLQ